jgi:CubicO group peptidase (beta-lactamase class C family)
MNIRTWPTWVFFSFMVLYRKESNAYDYTIPLHCNDGWETSTLSKENVSAEPLGELMHDIEKGLYKKTHCIIIVKNGRLVFEQYFPGRKFNQADGYSQGKKTIYSIDSLQHIASITKTVTSILTGIAIDKGLIFSEDDYYMKYLPKYSSTSGRGQDSVKICDLLTMQSGMAWDEWTYRYIDTRNDLVQLWHQNDPLAYVIKKPVIKKPGTEFTYNGGNYNILGYIIEKTSGMSLEEFANKFLFTPMKIDTAIWRKYPSGQTFVGDLMMKPRDMAKLGFLYLSNGRFQDHNLLSKTWIERSIKNHSAKNGPRYGYGWWLHTYTYDTTVIETYNAEGWGGQVICVVPRLQAVIVLTGGYYTDADEKIEKITHSYILPALLRIPPPAPLLPIPDTVPLATKYIRKSITDLTNGCFIPRFYTADLCTTFTAEIIKKCSAELKKLGKLTKLELLQCKVNNGLKSYQYRATYKKWIFFKQTLLLKAEIDQDDKIASINLNPE